MRNNLRGLGLLWCLLALAACQKGAGVPPQVAYYHWKSVVDLSAGEVERLNVEGVRRLYVKYMDVDWEGGQAVPKAPVAFRGDAWRAFEIVPTVFITNRTFLEGANPRVLAGQVARFLSEANMANGVAPTEYQFDCDWSGATRLPYFAFLEEVGRLLGGAALSVTIRLHQLRYPEQAGVPPADRGVLMYYNMGDISSLEEPNSILNNRTGARYLQAGQGYALPLDYALPVFSWVLAYRLGELKFILNQAECAALDTLAGVEKLREGQYQVGQNTYFGYHYLNAGDRLRCESASLAALEEAVRQLSKIQNQSEQLIFYHLDEKALGGYPPGLAQRLAEQLVGAQ